MSYYYHGVAFEKRVQKLFENNSWFVHRSINSRLPDLVALKNGKILLVECKTNPKKFTISERERLLHYANVSGGIPLFATCYKEDINFYLLNDYLGLTHKTCNFVSDSRIHRSPT